MVVSRVFSYFMSFVLKSNKTFPWIVQVEVVSRLSADNSIIPALDEPGAIVSPAQQLMQLNWNVKREIFETTETSPRREEYERQLKDFIDRNTVRAAKDDSSSDEVLVQSSCLCLACRLLQIR